MGDDEVTGHGGLPWTSLVRAWRHGPMRHDAGKVRISGRAARMTAYPRPSCKRIPSQPDGSLRRGTDHPARTQAIGGGAGAHWPCWLWCLSTAVGRRGPAEADRPRVDAKLCRALLDCADAAETIL